MCATTLRALAATLIFSITALLASATAQAGVSVSVRGNVATAQVHLDDAQGHAYDATVTVTFQSVSGLTPASLNLTAVLVDPADPALKSRLPGAVACRLASCGVSIDPAFPVLITVEPVDRAGLPDLGFRNDYTLEIHTYNLTWVPAGPYRLFKAPIGGSFKDYSSEILAGSVRARDRDGGFSQFLMVKDTRPNLLLGVPLIANQKLTDLQLRLAAAVLGDVLRADLNNVLNSVTGALALGNYALAINQLDAFSSKVKAGAGTTIANAWRAEHDLSNDAGDLLGLAATLRFSLGRLNGAP